MSGDNQPQALTATGEPLRGLNAAQQVEKERAEAWSWYANGGGGSIEYFDGYAWDRIVSRHIADEQERQRERGR
ncbi:hypothetical protein [Bradyrhizobium iriomotense]|uniref:DUF2934 domain-containing protein n=1 Tax=Bradyrhizobium iriomotense TaxID=441950 RepID=A0ABQ6AX00_9BRAD|nr:hypothetical protein [Bradyrhizobium iriomotense]GLR86525.1 hypothetical protein GCM10007857_32360 [Bradyrhizobium iriomotense]